MDWVSVPSRGNGVIDSAADFNLDIDGWWSFRPLSGKWGYRSTAEREELAYNILLEVSVPSRGNGVIDISVTFEGVCGYTVFPSPLGEMGLSILQLLDRLRAL